LDSDPGWSNVARLLGRDLTVNVANLCDVDGVDENAALEDRRDDK
jgi:hypothetical protein